MRETKQQIRSQKICLKSHTGAEGQSPPGSRVRILLSVCHIKKKKKSYLFIYYYFSLSDLEGAADAAIERRNEGEISTILSRCSPTTDRLLVERLNRAKATATKK